MRRTVVFAVVVTMTLLVGSGCVTDGDKDAQADETIAALNAWTAYWNDVVDVENALNRQYERAANKADNEQAALNSFMVFSFLGGRCFQRAAADLADVAPPDSLADAHQKLVRSYREIGRTMVRSAKQIQRVLRNPNPAYALYGEGERVVKKATKVVTRAEDRANRAWKVWKRAASAEEKRLKAELTALGVKVTE